MPDGVGLTQPAVGLGVATGRGRGGSSRRTVEIGPQRAQPIGIELVDIAGAFGSAADEAAFFEHAKMLRNGRPADRQLLGQLAHRAWSVRKQLEDRASGGVTEQTKTSIFVSDHDRKPKLTISAAASDRRAARAGVDRGGASGQSLYLF
jgi:hypothetical protein